MYSQCFPFMYDRDSRAPAPLRRAAATTLLHTVELDSFVAAELLLKRGWPQPAVLNMADEWNCGGAWCTKKRSQEEELFQRSSLPLSLWPQPAVLNMADEWNCG